MMVVAGIPIDQRLVVDIIYYQVLSTVVIQVCTNGAVGIAGSGALYPGFEIGENQVTIVVVEFTGQLDLRKSVGRGQILMVQATVAHLLLQFFVGNKVDVVD